MEHEGNVEKAILAEMEKPDSRLIERVTRHNQIIAHNYRASTERACECQLLGCARTFTLTLIPNQVLYPKYCENHRSEFRRENFLRQLAARPDVFRFDTVRILEPLPR
jgi:hypothetical protein